MTDRDCEDCTHCQTINEDQDNYCHLQQRVVYVTCDKFSPLDGAARNQTNTKD
ncbi:hypothetical protein [Pseudoduganella chitinolytica]|uniref:Uncharacterized protein n=1 Tax=Pseudoduganella chitinolytica TaxID=34070 RepID=A0ABY8BHS9_9BURK|nr:hypothetical protein [Pseudoduganella chitinolytica]WEF34908.1 hypothetical protein PX653_09150 [Pseudoduganella chitinolytica]